MDTSWQTQSASGAAIVLPHRRREQDLLRGQRGPALHHGQPDGEGGAAGPCELRRDV
jgi:hypothetical protein